MFILILLLSLQLDHEESYDLLSRVEIFDVGMARINEDSLYDIYTTNHDYAESYLINKKSRFEINHQLGLSQTIDLPEYEPIGRAGPMKKGLNIFYPNRDTLYLYCNQCTQKVTGTLKVPTPDHEKKSIGVNFTENAQADVEFKKTLQGHFAFVSLALEPNGLIQLSVVFPDVLHEFNLNLPAKEIFVGFSRKNPKQSSFSINSQDNHSSAWAKVDDDEFTDVFMSTGGLRAMIKHFHPSQVIDDQFYLYDSKAKNYSSEQLVPGLNDQTKCRTYKSMWVDFDGDGDLDLYKGCMRSPNQLLVQQNTDELKFVDMANDYKLNHIDADEFKWFNLEGNHLPELVSIWKNRLLIQSLNTESDPPTYETIFKSQPLGKKLNSLYNSIKVSDLNNNGEMEIIVTYDQYITNDRWVKIFSKNANSKYRMRKLSSFGLPESLDGHLVIADVDHDGDQDIISMKHGYFKNNGKKFMKKEKWMTILFEPRNYLFKNLVFFDSENNGQWDILQVEAYQKLTDNITHKILNHQFKEFMDFNHLVVHRNLANENNWLNIDLLGNKKNQDGVGAQIIIEGSNGKQYRQVFGSEDSFHSQGHYRQYIGLGKDKAVNIVVKWSDGSTTSLKDIKANQLLSIQQLNSKI